MTNLETDKFHIENRGQGLEYEGRELEAAQNLRNYYQWITDKFKPYLRGDGTEIGAGQGNYGHYLKPYFSNLDLVEPSKKQSTLLLDSFKDEPCIQVYSDTIDTYLLKRGRQSRDCICLVNVLEHIEDDQNALKCFHELLKTNGYLCIFVPAMPILYSKLDNILGHYRRYVLADINEKVTNAGFKVIEQCYMDIIGVAAWGLINTILGFQNLNSNMTLLYDRFFVPLTRALENKVEIPIGKSLMIVARKDV